MKKYCVVLLFMLSSCSTKDVAHNAPEVVRNVAAVSEPVSFQALINLEDSVQIIRSVIAQNKLGELLEEHDPGQLEILLNNLSPAQMAFESEVLAATYPLVACYYFKESPAQQEFIKSLDLLAVKYIDAVKFVLIDADKFFSLAQDAEIENFPTVLFVQGRDIVDHMEDNVTIDVITKLSSYWLHAQ